MKKGVRTARIIISLAITAAMATLILTSSIAVAQALGWTLKLQIIPLMISGATVQVLLWFGFTLIFGRLYCSAVCPLGTLQDIFWSLRRIPPLKNRLKPIRYAPPQNTVRLSILAASIILFLIGANAIALIIEPTEIFTRIIRLFRTEDFATPVAAAACTAAALILIATLSIRKGRIWCNTICPVGTALGVISTKSHMRFSINPDYCTACGKCQDVCKAQCISLSDLTVDSSRCVTCFNCTAVCDSNAITYTDTPATPASPLLQQIQK